MHKRYTGDPAVDFPASEGWVRLPSGMYYKPPTLDQTRAYYDRLATEDFGMGLVEHMYKVEYVIDEADYERLKVECRLQKRLHSSRCRRESS